MFSAAGRVFVRASAFARLCFSFVSGNHFSVFCLSNVCFPVNFPFVLCAWSRSTFLCVFVGRVWFAFHLTKLALIGFSYAPEHPCVQRISWHLAFSGRFFRFIHRISGRLPADFRQISGLILACPMRGSLVFG